MHNIHRSTPVRVGAIALLIVLAGTLSWGGSDTNRGDDLSAKIRGMEPKEQIEYLRGPQTAGIPEAVVDFHLGNAFYSLQQLDSALVYFGRATNADSSYSKAWVNMGLVYDAQRQASAARRCFEEALKVNPEDVLAMCHLGFNYFSHGQVDRAVKLYEKALAVDPESAQAHYNLGLAFADAKIFREALTEWTKVVELDPQGELGKTAAENVKLIKTYMDLDEP